MTKKKVKINRAPVLTLWAATVAERLGYDRDAALTLGKSVAGLNAQAKGQRLGIFEQPKDQPAEAVSKAHKPAEQFSVPILGRSVPAVQTPQGVRATAKGKPLDPGSVQRYLEQKFGQDLDDVQAAMEQLAQAHKPDELAVRAYALYEKFRPIIPEGTKGWGAKGELDLDMIRTLAESTDGN
jgi:hypothetical protein